MGVLTKTEKNEFLVGLQRNNLINAYQQPTQPTNIQRSAQNTVSQSPRVQQSTSLTWLQRLLANQSSTNNLQSTTSNQSANSRPIPPSSLNRSSPNVYSPPVTRPSVTQNESPPPPSSQTIKIVPLGGKDKVVTLSSSTTGQQLKEYIYANISQSLEPSCMSLYY